MAKAQMSTPSVSIERSALSIRWWWAPWGVCAAIVALAELLIALGRSWPGLALSLALFVALPAVAGVVPGAASPLLLALAFAPLVRLMSTALWPVAEPAAGFQAALAGVAVLVAVAAGARAARNAALGGREAGEGTPWRALAATGLPLLLSVAGVAGTIVRGAGGGAVPGLDGFATVALLAVLVQREFMVAAGPRRRTLAAELLFAIVPLLATFVAVVAGRIAAQV